MRPVAYAGLVIAAWLVSRFVPIRYRLAVWIRSAGYDLYPGLSAQEARELKNAWETKR